MLVQVLKIHNYTDYCEESQIVPCSLWTEVSEREMQSLATAIYDANRLEKRNGRYVMIQKLDDFQCVFDDAKQFIKQVEKQKEQVEKQKQQAEAKKRERSMERKRKQLEKLKKELGDE